MIIYRIENPDTENGMWYDGQGRYRPFIKTLTDGRSADLPMEWDARYGKGGRRWYSGCKDSSRMNVWFSAQDARELVDAGYRLIEFWASEFVVEEFQVIFTREGSTSRREIPLSAVWPELN